MGLWDLVSNFLFFFSTCFLKNWISTTEFNTSSINKNPESGHVRTQLWVGEAKDGKRKLAIPSTHFQQGGR